MRRRNEFVEAKLDIGKGNSNCITSGSGETLFQWTENSYHSQHIYVQCSTPMHTLYANIYRFHVPNSKVVKKIETVD